MLVSRDGCVVRVLPTCSVIGGNEEKERRERRREWVRRDSKVRWCEFRCGPRGKKDVKPY
jgi:hypothetical protein